MTTSALLSEYLSAYNNRDIDKIISFLDPNCQVFFNDQVILQGVAAMRPTYEQDFLDPQASATVLKYTQDENDEDRIRVVLKTHDNRIIDVTYVFKTKEEEEGTYKKKMIEHIIHSVQHQQTSQ